MPHYMLLLRDDRETWNNLSPEEMQKAVEKYYAAVRASAIKLQGAMLAYRDQLAEA